MADIVDDALGDDFCDYYSKYIPYEYCAQPAEFYDGLEANGTQKYKPNGDILWDPFLSDQYMEWANAPFTFDHFGEAIKTIFIISTLDNWPSLMYDGIDAVGVDKAPVRDNQIPAAFFFVAVIIMGGFLSFNLIISVVVDNFNKIKEEKEGSAFLTKEQPLWNRTKRL